MVNFEKLVEGTLRLITEEQIDPQIQDGSKSLYGFIQKKHGDLRSKWNNKYPGVYFPSETEFNSIIYDVSYGVTRFDDKHNKFSKFVEIYPLLDLLGSLYANNFKKGMDPSTALTTYDEFLSILNKPETSDVPLDFPAQNGWAQSLKTNYFKGTKTELGNLVVEDLFKNNPTMSFYQGIYRLLELRRKAFSVKIPDNWKSISGEKFIQDVFFKVNDIKSTDPKTRLSIRDDKISKIYDDVTTTMLLNLSLAAYKLYEQQVKANLPPESVEKALLDEELYKQFLGATGTTPVVWQSQQAQTTATPTPQNASFDSTLELLMKDLLSEISSAVKRTVYGSSNAGNVTAEPYAYSSKSDQTNLPKQIKTPEEENKQTQTSSPSLFAGPKEGESLYNLQNLDQAASSGLDQAKNLKKEMITLGNYFKKSTGIDWAGVVSGAGEIAKGLQVAPMMGK